MDTSDLMSEDQILIERGQIGTSTFPLLLNSVYWFNYYLFDRKSNADHINLFAEDYSIHKTKYGKEIHLQWKRERAIKRAKMERPTAKSADCNLCMPYVVDCFEKYLAAIPAKGAFYRRPSSIASRKEKSDVKAFGGEEAMTVEDIEVLKKWRVKRKKIANEEIKKREESDNEEICNDEALHRMGVFGMNDSLSLLRAMYWFNSNRLGMLNFKEHRELRKNSITWVKKKKKLFIEYLSADKIAVSIEFDPTDLCSQLYKSYYDATPDSPNGKFYFRPRSIEDADESAKVAFSDENLSFKELQQLNGWYKKVTDMLLAIRTDYPLLVGFKKVINDVKRQYLTRFDVASVDTL